MSTPTDQPGRRRAQARELLRELIGRGSYRANHPLLMKVSLYPDKTEEMLDVIEAALAAAEAQVDAARAEEREAALNDVVATMRGIEKTGGAEHFRFIDVVIDKCVECVELVRRARGEEHK